jgi:hypothetical protein
MQSARINGKVLFFVLISPPFILRWTFLAVPFAIRLNFDLGKCGERPFRK